MGKSPRDEESPSDTSSTITYQPKSRKRSRVALACLRCRSRKQKCDGAQDTCSTCKRLGLECRYKAHLQPRPDQKRAYINALEEHVANLERLLAESGQDSVTVDHWKEKRLQIRRDSYMHDESHAPDRHEIATEDDDPRPSNSSSGPAADIVTSLIGGDVQQEHGAATQHAELARLAPTAVAAQLMAGWMKHLAMQYPVVHSPWLQELQTRPESALSIFERSVLHLVYANSGRILEAVGESGDFRAQEHWEAAMRNMSTVLAYDDIRSCQYLLLLALYHLRGPKSLKSWTLTGLAVRQCIALGLHRLTHSELSIERELSIRVFWSCYYLDRGVSVALSRPPAISDSDIETEFPLDVDERIEDLSQLQVAAQNQQLAHSPPTTMTPFIHFMKLRVMESRIEHVMYRQNKNLHVEPSIIDHFLEQLAEWRHGIPERSSSLSTTYQDSEHEHDAYMIPYHKVVRLLLHSQLSQINLNHRYLQICAESCAGLCGAYKRLNRKSRADCSPLALQSLFISGLTLLYCLWLAPPGFLNVSEAVSECNLMLYVMSERSPSAQKYRDIFERVKLHVLDAVERRPKLGNIEDGVLDPEMSEKCRTLDTGLLDTVRSDYEQIIKDLSKGGMHAVRHQPEPLSSVDVPTLLCDATDYTTPESWNMSPGPLIDFNMGHTFGNFMDPSFMFDMQDLNAFNMVESYPQHPTS